MSAHDVESRVAELEHWRRNHVDPTLRDRDRDLKQVRSELKHELEKALDPVRADLAVVREIRDRQIETRALAKEKAIRDEEERQRRDAERERSRLRREWIQPILLGLLTSATTLLVAWLTMKGH